METQLDSLWDNASNIIHSRPSPHAIAYSCRQIGREALTSILILYIYEQKALHTLLSEK